MFGLNCLPFITIEHFSSITSKCVLKKCKSFTFHKNQTMVNGHDTFNLIIINLAKSIKLDSWILARFILHFVSLCSTNFCCFLQTCSTHPWYFTHCILLLDQDKSQMANRGRISAFWSLLHIISFVRKRRNALLCLPCWRLFWLFS